MRAHPKRLPLWSKGLVSMRAGALARGTRPHGSPYGGGASLPGLQQFTFDQAVSSSENPALCAPSYRRLWVSVLICTGNRERGSDDRVQTQVTHAYVGRGGRTP